MTPAVHRVTVAGSDAAFDCAEGESVLDAALRAGIGLPYSCRKGVCGNCAGRVVQGEAAAMAGLPLHNETCRPGELLFCAATPRTALEIAPGPWQRIDPTARKRFRAKVFRNERAAPDVSVLQLRLPAGQRAKFRAGQYLQVAVGDGSTRCYSMANPPHESDSVTLHIRHLPGGAFSPRVADLQPGELLDIELPFGAFCLPEPAAGDTRPLVFVAGGTGFAPVKAMLDDLAKQRSTRPATLIRGARRSEGLYLPSALPKWQKQWPNFRYVPALSEAPAPDATGTPPPAGAFAGRADEALAATCPDLAGHALYCCGSPAMVAAVRAVALRQGLAAEDFHADVFVEGPAAGMPA